MKGKLINKDQKWIVQYEEVDNTSFGIAAATGGTIIPSVKELPLHPIYITLNNSIKSKFSLEEGKEVEFEMVELENYPTYTNGNHMGIKQLITYAKLLNV